MAGEPHRSHGAAERKQREHDRAIGNTISLAGDGGTRACDDARHGREPDGEVGTAHVTLRFRIRRTKSSHGGCDLSVARLFQRDANGR